MTCELLLDPGRLPRGTVVGPDGKPLAGARALGLNGFGALFNWARIPLQVADFAVYGLGDGEGREVRFMHAEKKLAGVLRVRGDDRGPFIVKLEPWGAVKGQLVSAKGKPQAGLLLRIDPSLPGSGKQTDREGRFLIEGLAPDVPYKLNAFHLEGRWGANVFERLKLKAGETRDLGEVTLMEVTLIPEK
jgi:hypothetical protein